MPTGDCRCACLCASGAGYVDECSGHYFEGAKRHMIILGLILLLIGWLANISILTTIGIILIVIGVVLWILGATGRAVGGRKHWF